MRGTLLLSLPLTCTMTFAIDYSVRRETADSIEIYVLRDEPRQTEVRVAPSLGHNSYEMTVKGKRVFWSPYKSVGEFAARPAFLGNPLLWPWANRIDGMTYSVNGRRYALKEEVGNVRPGPNNTPIHGLLQYSKLWKVQKAEGSAGGAVLESKLEFWKYPELMAQFPFAHTIVMTYRLKDGALEVETSIENLSAEALPVSLGYHPYFQLNDAPRDEWTVHLAAKEKHVLSSRLIPTGEKVANPYGENVKLAGIVLDDVFENLVRDKDGFSRFSVQGKTEKITVEYGPKFTVAVVYAPAGRGFICFEPMTGITNAFNAAQAGWYQGLQSVQPGGTWREVFRIRVEGY